MDWWMDCCLHHAGIGLSWCAHKPRWRWVQHRTTIHFVWFHRLPWWFLPPNLLGRQEILEHSTNKQHNAHWRHGLLGPGFESIQQWANQSLQCHRWKTWWEHQVLLTTTPLMLSIIESCERKMIVVRLVKSSIASKQAHQSRGGAEAGCFDSMCARSSWRWILNHFVTLYVKNQRLTMQGHIVPMSMINLCCRMRSVMKLVITKKKLSLTISFMMCSMTRSNWCAPHQIQKKEYSSCIKS